MAHLRLKNDTKKANDQALVSAKALDSNIKTHDDLQRFLLIKANLRPIEYIIEDDMRRAIEHTQLLHPKVKGIEGLQFLIQEILYHCEDDDQLSKAKKSLLKLKRELEEEEVK